jgi:hypothetical protein
LIGGHKAGQFLRTPLFWGLKERGGDDHRWGKGFLAKAARARKRENLHASFLPKGQEAVHLSWRLLTNEELPEDALNRDQLKKVYSDVPFRTGEDIDLQCKKHVRMVKTVKWLFLLWGVVSLIILILGETNAWISRIVFVYGFYKFFVGFLRQTGKLKKSSRQLEQEKDELEMQHHDYHCKKNPQAFLRLKIENFERESREPTRKEAESLKHTY